MTAQHLPASTGEFANEPVAKKGDWSVPDSGGVSSKRTTWPFAEY